MKTRTKAKLIKEMKPGLDFIQVKKFVGFLNYYSGFKHHKQRQIKRMCAKFSFPLLAYNPLKLAPDKSKGTGDKEVAISQIPRTGASLGSRRALGTGSLGPKRCNSDLIVYADWLSVICPRRVTSRLVFGFPRVQFL